MKRVGGQQLERDAGNKSNRDFSSKLSKIRLKANKKKQKFSQTFLFPILSQFNREDWGNNVPFCIHQQSKSPTRPAWMSADVYKIAISEGKTARTGIGWGPHLRSHARELFARHFASLPGVKYIGKTCKCLHSRIRGLALREKRVTWR